MKINIQIDADTPEGRQIINYLKTFPEVVTFENTILNEPQQEYITQPAPAVFSSENYVTAEDFRIEAKKRAKILLKKHGVHS